MMKLNFLISKLTNPYSNIYLFTNRCGKPLTRITNLYKKNGKLETIQKQLGHSSLDTTMRYIHNDYDSFYNDYSKLWKNETILAK